MAVRRGRGGRPHRTARGGRPRVDRVRPMRRGWHRADGRDRMCAVRPYMWGAPHFPPHFSG